MIITTAKNKSDYLIKKALSLSLKYDIKYHARYGVSLQYLLETVDPQIFVVNKMRGLSYYERDEVEVFYHPNMAAHRITNLKRDLPDSMAAACKLESGMSFFDGTLGLGADSLAASYVVGGSGAVTAVEKSFPIYMLVEEGLKFYAEQNPEWISISERINIKNADNLDFMRQCKEQSFDVVYLDFMFNYPVTKAIGIQGIRNIASYDTLTQEHINEALRITRGRVVVKTGVVGVRNLAKLGFVAEKEDKRRNFYYAVLGKR